MLYRVHLAWAEFELFVLCRLWIIRSIDKWWLHWHDLIDIFMMKKIQFLKNIIIIITKVFGFSVYAVWFCCCQGFLNYLTFQSFDFERTRWRLSQKRVVRTKLNIYGFITHVKFKYYWGKRRTPRPWYKPSMLGSKITLKIRLFT